ncbi:hypothetical protein [Paenarthrobacter histidinolovorans]|uniref:Uncharacterized protein n=1 Tax=Paenarthrobacter histidinolovorans TaxID=43664 RepID=A0ABW8NAD8_9MICC
MNEHNSPAAPQPGPAPESEPETAGQPGSPSTTAEPYAGWGAPPSSASQGWGKQQHELPTAARGGRAVKRVLMVAGIAVVVVAGTAAGFYSLGSAGSADAANVPPGQTDAGGLGGQAVPGQGGTGQDGVTQDGMTQDGMGRPGQGQMGGNMPPEGLGLAGGPGAAVHSEYVVLRDGAYVAMADQLGTVTDVSSASLTVKSADGFTRSYAVSSETAVAQGIRQRGTATSPLTLADVAAGSAVRVTAAKDGDNYTAESIRLTPTTGQGGTSSQGSTPGGTSS